MKKYFINSSLRRRYTYMLGTLNPEQIYTTYKDNKHKFNTITLKDYKQKESLLNALDLVDLDKHYNSEDIKVSVIMPTYNQEKFIAKAIESILNQKHENIELIVVNDGSTDNTLNVINEISDKYVGKKQILILNKENGGTGSAINEGLKHASGKYVTWVSSDNEYFPDFIETLTDILESQPDIDYAFSAFEWYSIPTGQSNILNGFSGYQLTEGKYNKSYIKFGYDPGLCFLYRMDILNKLHFYDECQAEDYLLVAKAGEFCEFYNTKKVLGRYNDHSETLSRKKPEETHKTEILAKQIASKY